MKKTILLIVGALFLFQISLKAQAGQEYVKTTHPFSTQDNETLYLDRYVPTQNVGNEVQPCLIYVFGGGFVRGSRDVPQYMPYFEYFIENGYTVISIDYRLGLKNLSEQLEPGEEEVAALLVNAIDIAVEDLFDATRYVIEHSQEWNIDTNNIVINGSSAGAITVLQAEYAVCNGTNDVDTKLPSDFRYAGVISFAGAILLTEGDLNWSKTPAPIMLMHGDADVQVPYDRIEYGPMGFYGAKSIAESLDRNNHPYYFYQFENYGHQIAGDPMQNNREDILSFLNTFVKEKKQFKINKTLREIGRPEVDKNFGVRDYIRGNFGRAMEN